MAKLNKPKPIKPARHWCVTGNHRCYPTDLVIIHQPPWGGICRACVQSRGDLRDYWKIEELT